MTTPANIASAYFTLRQAVQTLCDAEGELFGRSAALHRLRNLSIVLEAMPPAPSDGGGRMTLERALAVAECSRHILATLSDSQSPQALRSDLAQAMGETLRSVSDELGAALRQRQAERVRGLYVIIDPQVTRGRPPEDIAAAALRGGARMLQLRDKLRDKGQSLPLARRLQELCQQHDALLIINDHADLAAAVGAGGLHVGQTDLPVAEVRQVLAPWQVLGRSNHELSELQESEAMGADHVAFGPIYTTTTKNVGHEPQGMELLRKARQIARKPLVAIGGINADNVAPVVGAGADAICVTAAVGAAPDPEAAAAGLVEAIIRAGGRA